MTTQHPYSRSGYAPSASAPSGRRYATESGIARAAYLLAWSLVGVAGVAGTLFSLYRNDVLLAQARSRGVERQYLALERSLLGSPGWGTPRSMLSESERAALQASALSSSVAASVGNSSPLPASAPQPAARIALHPAEHTPSAMGATAPASAERATADGLKIVSLDALGTLPAPAAVAPAAPAARAARGVTSEPPSAPQTAARPVAASEPKPRVVAARNPTPAAPSPAARPAPAPPPAAPPPPVNDNPLKAAIRSAVVKESAK